MRFAASPEIASHDPQQLCTPPTATHYTRFLGAVIGPVRSAIISQRAGDVSIADSSNNQVVKLPAGGGAQTTVGSGLSNPRGVAVDGAGDVFIADSFNRRVVEVPAGGGAQTTVGSGLGSAEGVAVDGAGNVFIADFVNNRVVELQRSQPPTLTFAAIAVGSFGQKGGTRRRGSRGTSLS